MNDQEMARLIAAARTVVHFHQIYGGNSTIMNGAIDDLAEALVLTDNDADAPRPIDADAESIRAWFKASTDEVA